MATLAARGAEPEAPALVCVRCGEGFLRAPHLALHVARRHAGPLTPDERAAFEAALAEEDAWLRDFRVRMRGALAAFAPVALTLLITLLLYLGGAPLAMAVLLVAPMLGFSLLAYVMTVRGEL